MAGFVKDLKKILRDNGCEFVRSGKGSHEIWVSPISGINFTVPNSTKSKHTCNNALRQAGLPKAF